MRCNIFQKWFTLHIQHFWTVLCHMMMSITEKWCLFEWITFSDSLVKLTSNTIQFIQHCCVHVRLDTLFKTAATMSFLECKIRFEQWNIQELSIFIQMHSIEYSSVANLNIQCELYPFVFHPFLVSISLWDKMRNWNKKKKNKLDLFDVIHIESA